MAALTLAIGHAMMLYQLCIAFIAEVQKTSLTCPPVESWNFQVIYGCRVAAQLADLLFCGHVAQQRKHSPLYWQAHILPW